MAFIGTAAHEASVRRWSALREMLGEELFPFVATKWRLTDNDWSPGDIPHRPRSAEEIATRLGYSVEKVRDIDAEVVAIFRKPELAKMPDWGEMMTVPVDEAQAWWDEHYADTFLPNGQLPPRPASDFRVEHVRKGQLEAVAGRAAVPMAVVDALRQAWPSISAVQVEIWRGRPHVSCNAYDPKIAERLASVMETAGAETKYGADSEIVSGWWPAS
jgi:hypothetical protein